MHGFLSHTKRDETAKNFTVNLKDEADKVGLVCFCDYRSIPLGVTWGDHIKEAAASCAGGFVAILSPQYFQRHWCMKELDLAFKHKQPILPVYYSLSGPSELPDKDAFCSFLKENDSEQLLEEDDVERWWKNIEELKKIQPIRRSAEQDADLAVKEAVINWLFELQSEPLDSSDGWISDRSLGGLQKSRQNTATRVVRLPILDNSKRELDNRRVPHDCNCGKQSFFSFSQIIALLILPYALLNVTVDWHGCGHYKIRCLGPGRHIFLSICGNTIIDCRGASQCAKGGKPTKVWIIKTYGDVKIIVPPVARVEFGGFLVCGNKDLDVEDSGTTKPPLDLRLKVVMLGGNIKASNRGPFE